jgi:hypothetical protein
MAIEIYDEILERNEDDWVKYILNSRTLYIIRV